MLRTFLNAFRVPEIRKKLAFTAAMLALYRAGAYIPAPGINVDAVKDISENFTGSNVLGFLNLFSGGSLQRFAIFALGIMPYITASIMLQLLTVVIPALDKLRKEGEVGQQKITQYTRYLTVALAFGQSIGYVFLFRTFSSGSADVVEQPGPDLRGHDAVPGTGDHRRHRLHAGGPAAHPGAVREARRGPANGRRRLYLPAAAREHGGRDPGDLRRLADGVPTDSGPADPIQLGQGPVGVLQPQRLALPGRGVLLHHHLHLLLHGGHLQPRGAGGQPEEVRRGYPRGGGRQN